MADNSNILRSRESMVLQSIHLRDWILLSFLLYLFISIGVDTVCNPIAGYSIAG
jgi:hypothetical protein